MGDVMGGVIFCKQVDGPIWMISADYFSQKLNEHARAVPGLRYDPTPGDKGRRVGYVDAVAACVARLARAGIRVSGADKLPAPDAWREARTPFLYAVEGLRPYQVEGVRFCIMRSGDGCLLADGMRLGKSATSLTAARAFKQKTLIVVPPHLVGVWARRPDAPEGPGEIAKWWPDAWRVDPGVVVVEGVKKTHPIDTGAMVVVCHYDIAYAWKENLVLWGFKTLICDEVHLLMGYSSRRTKTVRSLAEFAARRIYLSGTPMTSRPRDLHPVLDTLCPGRFGFFASETQDDPVKPVPTFSKLFCNAHKIIVGSGPEAKEVWDFKGASNLDTPDGRNVLTREETLSARLKYLMLRRVKSEVDNQLPPKDRQIVDVAVGAKAQIGVTGGLLAQKGAGLRRALDLAADGKLKQVVKLLEGHILDGEKVIAFCYRRQFAEILATQLNKKLENVETARVVWTHGGLTPKERDKRIHSVRTWEGSGALVSTIDTTSTGIDLSFCGVAVFCELTWEPHELIQAEERTYQFGKDTKSFIQYVIARGTGDDLILRGIIQKLDDFEKAIGPVGDRMKEDLSARKGPSGLERLMAVIDDMQKARPPKKVKVRRAGG